MFDNVNNCQARINGQPATHPELISLAFAGFAHFTAMQVRDRKIKGLDLHLARLRNASVSFFGRALADEQLLSYIRSSIEDGPKDQSLTVTVFSPKGEFTAASMDAEPAALIRTGPPSQGPDGPLRLSTGESGKTFYLHQAIRQGFDDAAFVDSRGHLSEATIWNLVFWDGDAVIWPEASMLRGTMMGIVQRQLERLDIPQRHEAITFERLRELSAAAVMNSWTPGIAVTAIAATVFAEAAPFISLLHEAYEAEPAMLL
ncbi:aminotransferase class IV family protein [Halopseudomonas pelagia]|uniref:aminotransferase class IV family protein n=1 Tax=Halopseudomonas pelagia TaxID=553151 RepID=UPI0003A8F4CD|nr:aminotransferase class IV family protein [Halopseudomonas pelagia]